MEQDQLIWNSSLCRAQVTHRPGVLLGGGGEWPSLVVQTVVDVELAESKPLPTKNGTCLTGRTITL